VVRQRVNAVSGDSRKNHMVQLVRQLSASGLVRDYVALITRFESKGGSRVFRRPLLGSFFAFSILFSNADALYVARKPPY
jgi:hypothetical protein